MCAPEAGRRTFESFKAPIDNATTDLLRLSESNRAFSGYRQGRPAINSLIAESVPVREIQVEAISALRGGITNPIMLNTLHLLRDLPAPALAEMARRISTNHDWLKCGNGRAFTKSEVRVYICYGLVTLDNQGLAAVAVQTGTWSDEGPLLQNLVRERTIWQARYRVTGAAPVKYFCDYVPETRSTNPAEQAEH